MDGIVCFWWSWFVLLVGGVVVFRRCVGVVDVEEFCRGLLKERV